VTHPLRYGLKLSGQDTTLEVLRTIWRIADEAGFDHVWGFDHLAAIGNDGPDRPVYEGWMLLAAMAAATKRVRIGCMVTGNTYRHPVLLAKQAVTVDHLSGGRLEFGIGAAWAQIEHIMFGIQGLDHRVGRLNESLSVIKSLWMEDRTGFEGRYYALRDAIANPKPIQKPHPPIWIGASGVATLRLVARHADVWNWVGGETETLKVLIDELDRACDEIGRDRAEIRRSAQLAWDGHDTHELLEKSALYLELGITEQIIEPDDLNVAEATSIANKVADALHELRNLERAHS
jgi:F420-dependent oxidoreductase-like protein